MMRFLLAVFAVPAIAPGVRSFQTTPIVGRIAQRAPRLNAVQDSAILSEIDALWQTYPYTAAALICGFKASAADIVAQSQENNNAQDDIELKSTKMLTATAVTEKEPEAGAFDLFSNADWRRNAAFIAYGALYQGITQEFFFNHLYPIWFGTGTDLATVATKVSFTLLVQTTLLTLPSLYASKAVIEGYSMREAAQQYIYDVRYEGLLQKFYILWGPALSLTFGVIPEQYRVTFVAMISFFWLIILSSIAGKERDEGVE